MQSFCLSKQSVIIIIFFYNFAAAVHKKKLLQHSLDVFNASSSTITHPNPKCIFFAFLYASVLN